MSRSRRRTPIHSWCTKHKSEAWDKRWWHRALRRKVNQILAETYDDTQLPHFREVSDPWLMAKDGKGWFGHMLNDHRPVWRDGTSWADWANKLMRK